MYEMVQNAYKVTLVSCVVPLVAGLYWRRANVTGAALSVVFGLASWGAAELLAPDATVPPQLVGLGFSILGMLLGSLVPRRTVAHAPHAAAHAAAREPQK
jgi:Na+/pantothenate symporter